MHDMSIFFELYLLYRYEINILWREKNRFKNAPEYTWKCSQITLEIMLQRI